MKARPLSQYMAELRLRPSNHGLSWLVSRLRSRRDQERLIRFWNRWQTLPEGLDLLPRFSPGIQPFWKGEAL